MTQVVALPGYICPPGSLHADGGRSFSPELLGHCQPPPGQPHSLQPYWDRHWSGHWFYPGQLSQTAETFPAHLANILSRRPQTWSTSPSGWQCREDWSFSLQSFTSSMIGSVSLRTSTPVSLLPSQSDGEFTLFSSYFSPQERLPAQRDPLPADGARLGARGIRLDIWSSADWEPELRPRQQHLLGGSTISKLGIFNLKYWFFFSSHSLHWSYWMVWWMFGFVLKSVSSSTGLSSRRNKTWQFTAKFLLDSNF